MSKKRRLRRNQQEPPEPPNAVMVETGKLFGGLKVFILVPISTGLDPKEVARIYEAKIDELTEIAKQPTMRDLVLASADAVPDMLSRAKEN